MRVIIQRSLDSSVLIDNKELRKINNGMVLLVAFSDTDNSEVLKRIADKIINLRIFSDENNKLNKSIKEVDGEILSISQFTLYGDISKGNRPSFEKSLNHTDAETLYLEFNNYLKEKINVVEGKFRSNMIVNINNDGPTTIIIDSENL